MPGKTWLARLRQVHSTTGNLTRITLPIEVVLGVAAAFLVLPNLLTCRAVSKGDVPVRNVVKEVDLALVEQQPSGNGMDRRVAPAFVKEASITVKRFEKVHIGL